MFEGFLGALILTPMLPRDARLSASCTSDRRSFSILVKELFNLWISPSLFFSNKNRILLYETYVIFKHKNISNFLPGFELKHLDVMHSN